ncbi:heterokaryon incompatibility protein-domain-containing protein [Hypoxylon sp. FL1857]|nr:heterokaryon incompatibility protein-domain-containing protein [Hypoxylon sp. FL1857]
MAVTEQLIRFGVWILISLLRLYIRTIIKLFVRHILGGKRCAYSTLKFPNSIRVLSLESGHGDKLYGRLIEVPVDAPVPYEALSYVWGDSTRTHLIHLRNGYSLPITSSLYHALRNLRPTGDLELPRLLWADGVCINQDDMDERAQQVRMMSTIYSRAYRVITYIGEDTCDVDLAVDLMKKIARYADKVISGQCEVSISHPEELPDHNDMSWGSLKDFLSRPWYTRKWILQESVVNRNSVMMCGRKYIDWCDFLQMDAIFGQPKLGGLLCLNDILPVSRPAMDDMAIMRYELLEKDGPKRMTLLSALGLTRHFNATDPKDCVFAVASLVSDIELDIDYNKSERQVFIEAAAKILEGDSNGDLCMLSAVGVKGKLDLPSWVPDWSISPGRALIADFTRFKCGGNTKARPEVSVQDGTLTILGVGKGRIIHLTDLIINWMKNPREGYKWIQEQFKHVSRLGAYTTETVYMEAPRRTMTSDLGVQSGDASIAPNSHIHGFEVRVRPLTPDTEREKRLERVEQANASLGHDSIDRGNADFGYTPEDIFGKLPGAFRGDAWGDAVVCGFRMGTEDGVGGGFMPLEGLPESGNIHRKLCTTSEGFIGMVEPESQIGDIVACLEGAYVPHILRPTGDGSWSLIGDCYVHGLMDGEAFRGKGKVPSEKFTLV